jgi:hypothetical protein
LQISTIFNSYGPIGGYFDGPIDIAMKTALVKVKSLVLKQAQEEALQIVSITYRKHNRTTSFHISTVFNCYGSIGGHFGGGLVEVAPKAVLLASQWLKA